MSNNNEGGNDGENGEASVVGPWGGQNGVRWDDGWYKGVSQVIVCHGASIDSIQVQYYDKKGRSFWSDQHGASTGGINTSKVKLDFPEEYLVSIGGYYGSMAEDGPVIIRSLVFESNRKKYGPFGIQHGKQFSVPPAKGGNAVVGFHGRSSWHLDSIGVYVKPLLQRNFSNTTFSTPKPFPSTIGTTDNYKNKHYEDTESDQINKKVFGNSNQVMSTDVRVGTSRKTVSNGPWGGSNGGMIFDDGVYTGVRQVHLARSGGGVVSIQVCYDLNGEAIWGNKNGGSGGNRLDRIAFDYPSEVLTHITGYYGATTTRGSTVVKSLTFHTNRRKYGPFGEEQGSCFSSGSGKGVIVGFHGRKGNFLESVGVHVAEGTTTHVSSLSFPDADLGRSDAATLLPRLPLTSNCSFDSFELEGDVIDEPPKLPISSNNDSYNRINDPMFPSYSNNDSFSNRIDETKLLSRLSIYSSYEVFPIMMREPSTTQPAIFKEATTTRASGSWGRVKVKEPTAPATVKEPIQPAIMAVKEPPMWTSPRPWGGGMVKEQSPTTAATVKEAPTKPPIIVKEPRKWTSSAGPWGGEGGKYWDDGTNSEIRRIFLTRGEAIYCLQIEYDQNGLSVWSPKHGGGSEGTSYMIILDYPGEVLTRVSGYLVSFTGDERKSVVKSLTFYTNKGTYGPYGEETGTYFSSAVWEGAKIVGFHGRSGCYLNAIGVHLQPWANYGRDFVQARRPKILLGPGGLAYDSC